MVSMDDFGAGYSSLNSLKDMPLDVLKLDAEFFRGDGEDGRGEIVISEALQLAKKLHMRTVAEGVEAREQVDFLAEKGCDMIQGYYYSKPLPKKEYEGCLKEEMIKIAEDKERLEKEELRSEEIKSEAKPEGKTAEEKKENAVNGEATDHVSDQVIEEVNSEALKTEVIPAEEVAVSEQPDSQ